MPKFFSSPQMHARWQHHIPHIPGGGGGSHFYFLMLSPNLWSKIFPLPSALDLEFSQGGGGGGFTLLLFDAESKSLVKNFSLYQALWT